MNEAGTISRRAARILVVEDELAQREFLSCNLSAEGWAITEAADAEEGLLLARESQPDAIVLDWMLPKRSGLDLCRELKARREFRDVPILMLSARAEGEDRVRGLDTGADDYLPKPGAPNFDSSRPILGGCRGADLGKSRDWRRTAAR